MAPARSRDDSCLLAELKRMAEANPKEVNYAAISRAFGTPKPTLANSYEPELLNLRTFPTLMGYSSRIMAESWESNTLYWAALADELSFRPPSSTCGFRSGPASWWSRSSPRIWKTGPPCCDRCAGGRRCPQRNTRSPGSGTESSRCKSRIPYR